MLAVIRIYARVVADLWHPGHVRFFRAARDLGDHLTVSVVPDDRVAAHKGRRPLLDLAARVELVAACRWVDEVITDGPRVTTLDFMTSRNFHVYAFGAANSQERAARLADCRELPAAMRREIPYTHGISSSQLRQRLKHPS
jgi:cytidyltransferase-like protein